jgi:hypothetical protein
MSPALAEGQDGNRALLRRGAHMVSLTASLVTFLALIAWRFVFARLQRRPMATEIGDPRRRGNNLLDRVGLAVIAGDGFEHGAQVVDLFEREDRAKAYLRRIGALTGAVQIGNNYVLEIGTTRFHVRDRYVRRLQGVRDPKCEYEETCFCLPYTRVPTAEQIATALLALANNPALFDRWAAQIGAVKADGEAFARA